MAGTYFQVRSTDLSSSKVDDELVLLDMRTGNYFGLNHVAARVWELLEEPREFESLVAMICREYGVRPEDCSGDVRSLLDDLIAQGLAETHGTP